MDYCGGTYVSQVEASSPAEALLAWARNLDPAPIAAFDEQAKPELIAEVQTDGGGLAPLRALANSWCASALTSGGLALVNIIATLPSTNS
jgi:hypothetical protein